MARSYRMACDASVCFDIVAESEEDAVDKAKAAMFLSIDFDNETDGLDTPRTYLKCNVEPTVEDWYDDEEVENNGNT